ncbi:MAG: hypothetical protein D6815_01950 [Candidatus Dadabacteria bacterium]|nr:MAG: hypothetical protein D6815_01950 [Candidatus Dadabacteria bacterium]
MLLVVGWDGASLDVVEPLLEAGRLPALAELIQRGAVRPVRSTRPPVTYPAWTSFLTGCHPWRHALVDFAVREGYRIRFLSARDRRVPTLWARMGAAGLKVGLYGVPATYPPEPLRGIVVPGFDTPFGAASKPATHPPDLGHRLIARYGTLAVQGPQQLRIDRGWHARALATMLEQIERRTGIVCDLLARERFDAFFVYYGESDTVAHHFWHFSDPSSPRYDPNGDPEAVARVYGALDAALARLCAAAGSSANVVVISDHGSGGTSDRAVFWNRWLADHGWLAFKPQGPLRWTAVKRSLLRAVPPRAAGPLFRRLQPLAARVESGSRFSGIDWKKTLVFSQELPYDSGLCFNLKGREPSGTVEPRQVEELFERLRTQLLAFRDPTDGGRVVESVALVDEPERSARGVDVELSLRLPGGYSYAAGSSRAGRERVALRRLQPEEMSGARGSSMPGSHRELGLCVLSGPGVARGRFGVGTLADAGATVLALAGFDAGAEIDGRPWLELLAEGGAKALGSQENLPCGPGGRASPGEERELAETLRALGYVR